jgi:hypothetical protein
MFVGLYGVLAVLLLDEPVHQAVVIAAGSAAGTIAACHLAGKRKAGARAEG